MQQWQVIRELNETQLKQLHQLYQNEWWSKHRSLHDVIQMARHSDIIIGFWDELTQQLVGFARALTDFSFRACIYDVIVHPSYRKTGLGRRLMEAISEELNGVEQVELYCLPEMIPYYNKFGFSPVTTTVFMRKVNNKK